MTGWEGGTKKRVEGKQNLKKKVNISRVFCSSEIVNFLGWQIRLRFLKSFLN